jgi:hypothetical protein
MIFDFTTRDETYNSGVGWAHWYKHLIISNPSQILVIVLHCVFKKVEYIFLNLEEFYN